MSINLKDLREAIVFDLYQYDLMNKEITDLLTLEIIDKIDDIDDVIASNLFNYSIERLGFLDRAIIRLATYELMETETPSAIIIDEAVNLSKKYTDLDDEKQHKFNNKLLDNISKNIRG